MDVRAEGTLKDFQNKFLFYSDFFTLREKVNPCIFPILRNECKSEDKEEVGIMKFAVVL